MHQAMAIFRFRGIAVTPQGPALYQVGNENIWQFIVSLLLCIEQEMSRY